MRDRSNRYQVQNTPSLSATSAKKIGGYLVDAGLLTAAQINVALNDQQSTGMRFGEIVVARGWLKEQTVEWIMNKVVEPERKAIILHQQATKQVVAQPPSQPSASQPNRWGNQGAQPVRQTTEPTIPPAEQTASKPPTVNPKFVRREVPISKPLPSVNSSDGDVNWVG